MAFKIDENPRNPADRVVKKLYRIIRDVKRTSIRNKLSKTAPAPAPEDSEGLSYHMLLCKRDLLIGLWSLKSFFLANRISLPFIFHEDGSLSESDMALVRHHFPGSRIIPRDEADQEMAVVLEDRPVLREWRNVFPLSLKILDVPYFAPGKHLMFMDPDILFFRESEELLSYPGFNTFNRDPETAYLAGYEELSEIFGFAVIERVNSGLWIAGKEDFDVDRLDSFFNNPEFSSFQKNRPHVAEQTLFALLMSYSGGRHLPEGYDVEFLKEVEGSISKHYVGKIRYGFEVEGLRYLLKNGFIRKWQDFVDEHKTSDR